MDWIMPLLAGLGIGSILKSLIDNYIARRNLSKDQYNRKKEEIYIGLLSCIHKSAFEKTKEAGQEYALWQMKCKLFASENVYKYSEDFANATTGENRQIIGKKLLSEMKKDLKNE